MGGNNEGGGKRGQGVREGRDWMEEKNNVLQTLQKGLQKGGFGRWRGSTGNGIGIGIGIGMEERPRSKASTNGFTTATRANHPGFPLSHCLSGSSVLCLKSNYAINRACSCSWFLRPSTRGWVLARWYYC